MRLNHMKLGFSFPILIIGAVLITLGVIFRPFMLLTFLLISVFIFLDPKDNNLIAMLFFMYPLAAIFKLSPSSASLFTYLQLLVEIKLLIKRSVSKNFMIAWMLYGIYIFIGMGTDIVTFIKQLLLPLLLYYIVRNDIRKDLQRYAEYFIIALIISSVLAALKDVIPGMSGFIQMKSSQVGYGVYVERFSGIWGDPNYYAINLILGMCLVIFFHARRCISTQKTVIVYVILMLFGAATGSKSFFLMAAVITLVPIFSAFSRKKYFLGFSGLIVLGIGMYLIFSGEIPIFENVLARFRESDSDLTTGRTALWSQYLKYYGEHPFVLLFGNGIGKGYTFHPPHSTYLDYTEYYGILGSSLFIIACHFACSRQKKFFSLINVLPLVSLLVLYTSLSMISFYDFMLQISMAMMVICQDPQMVRKNQSALT